MAMKTSIILAFDRTVSIFHAIAIYLAIKESIYVALVTRVQPAGKAGVVK